MIKERFRGAPGKSCDGIVEGCNIHVVNVVGNEISECRESCIRLFLPHAVSSLFGALGGCW